MTINSFTEAETAIRAYIETQWALSSYATLPLVWEAEIDEGEINAESYVAVIIEGTYHDKFIYGSVGKRSSVEAGIVFLHSFSPPMGGKARCTAPLDTLMQLLELRSVASFIDFEGGNPPSPVHYGRNELDQSIPPNQPSGDYYRCSASVPFIVRGTR